MTKDLEALCAAALESDEQLLWSDRPVPVYFTSRTAGFFAMGVFWCVCVLAAVGHSHHFRLPESFGWQLVLEAFIVSGFLLFGLFFLAAPFLLHRRLARTLYAVTDRRAMSFTAGRKPRKKTWPLNKVRQVRFVEKENGTGDVTLVSGVRVEGTSPLEEENGFQNIKNPKHVAHLVASQVETLHQPASDPSPSAPTHGQDAEPFQPLLVDESPSTEDRGERNTARILGVIVFITVGSALFWVPWKISGVLNMGVPGYLFLVTLVVLLLQIRTVLRAVRSLHWPTTEGTVEESYIQFHDDGYTPRVRYRYQVGGKEYLNTEITTRQRSTTMNREAAEEIVSRYPEGFPVTVHYHPKKPGVSVLEPGKGFGNWLVLGILLICFVASAVWLVLSW